MSINILRYTHACICAYILTSNDQHNGPNLRKTARKRKNKRGYELHQHKTTSKSKSEKFSAHLEWRQT